MLTLKSSPWQILCGKQAKSQLKQKGINGVHTLQTASQSWDTTGMEQSE